MKKLFLYISIGIILLAIPITVFLVGKNQEVRKRAAPASTLSFSPSTQTVKVGEPFTLDVKLDTATNQVGLVQLRIVYDPAFITAQEMTNGPLAPSIRVSKKIDPNGKVSMSVGAKDTTHPIVGSGTIATVSLVAIKASATPISIKFTASPDTAANGIGEGQSDVVVGRSPATITILNADGTTAAADAIGEPISSSSGSLASAVTPTLTPSPAASESASASPSALLITSLTKDESVATGTPVISGKGIPGSTITIVIHSDTQQTAVVTVDANGNWVYTPATPLAPGPHTVTAQVTDANTGTVQTQTTAFVVSAGASAEVSSGSAIPATGSVNTTVILITLGALLLLSGVMIPIHLP